MARRKVRTLSSNLIGAATKGVAVPSPHIPTKIKKSFEIITDEEEPVSVVDINQIEYSSVELIKTFEEYNKEYFNLVKEQVLRHQALRTAINQVGAMTSKEFNASFVLLDTETDEAISALFKLNFITSLVGNLNEHFHTHNALDKFDVFKELFGTTVEPVKQPARLDTKKLVEQIGKLIKTDPVGPYGMNGNRNDKSKP